ncbi:LCP family protein [bacterium]|nr:LCP family protein [bacterium]
MNTFERHRQYRLRRHRSRLLRRRVFLFAGVTAVFLTAWSLFARFHQNPLTPPPPDVLGARAVRSIAHGALDSFNQMYQRFYPGRRDSALAAARTLFPRSPLPHAMLQERGTAYPVNLSAAEKGGLLDLLLIGLDSRLGEGKGRADALHLLSIDPSVPEIQITSIPRGTFSYLGYEDDAYNILANVRAERGRQELLRRVARLCGRDSIRYYMEIGFSDALGLLSLLGYPDPGIALQELRHREGYQYGDHDRSYNQGQFIRHALLRALPLLEGVTGEVILSAGQDLLHTNLSVLQCRGLVCLLNDAGLTERPDLVRVHLRSRFRKRIEQRHALRGNSLFVSSDADMQSRTIGTGAHVAPTPAERILRRHIANAESSRSAAEMYTTLWTLFEQHAWLQVQDEPSRRALRDTMAQLLIGVCQRLQRVDDIAHIRRTLKADELLFSPPVPVNAHESALLQLPAGNRPE